MLYFFTVFLKKKFFFYLSQYLQFFTKYAEPEIYRFGKLIALYHLIPYMLLTFNLQLNPNSHNSEYCVVLKIYFSFVHVYYRFYQIKWDNGSHDLAHVFCIRVLRNAMGALPSKNPRRVSSGRINVYPLFYCLISINIRDKLCWALSLPVCGQMEI